MKFLTIGDLQGRINHWQQREFRPNGEAPNPLADALVICEEAGEVARCAVKAHQNIRGGPEHWNAELRKELADVIIATLAAFSNAGIDATEAIEERWAVVGARKFASKDEA